MSCSKRYGVADSGQRMNVAPPASASPRHRQIALGDRVHEARIPFLVLLDVALQNGHAHRLARRVSADAASRACPRVPATTSSSGARSGDPRQRTRGPRSTSDAARPRSPSAPAAPRDRRRRRRSPSARPAAGHLAVAKKLPRKAVPDVLAAELARDPDRRASSSPIGRSTRTNLHDEDGEGRRERATR